jgi:phosphohistidine phosphatase SixA
MMTARDDPAVAADGHLRSSLLLVRHAHAGIKRDRESPDGLRPLSREGWAQAEGLVVRLKDFPIERIVSSPTLCCHQTVQPLARDRRLRIERSSALRVESPITELLGLVNDPTLQDAALCTHGEVIDRLFAQLGAHCLVTGHPLRWPKGATWVLQRLPGGLVRARYLPPLALRRHQPPDGVPLKT